MMRAMHRPVLTYIIAMLMLSTLGVYVQEAGLDPVTTVFFRCAIGATPFLLPLLFLTPAQAQAPPDSKDHLHERPSRGAPAVPTASSRSFKA